MQKGNKQKNPNASGVLSPSSSLHMASPWGWLGPHSVTASGGLGSFGIRVQKGLPLKKKNKKPFHLTSNFEKIADFLKDLQK